MADHPTPSVLERIGATLAAEFSDVNDWEQLTRITLRLVLAALLGGALGWERESHGKAAGVRTHMLVAVGAALFVLVPQQAGMHIQDLSRVLQGVVAGIGFLCAGTILKGDRVSDVKGLTTAAGLWMTAAIGLAAGLGREATALLSTLLALAVLALVPHLGRSAQRRRHHLHAPLDTDTPPAPPPAPPSPARPREED